jgi:HTH-type transcriptional regulator/antitoxin HigA
MQRQSCENMVIESEAEYEAALARVETLMDAAAGSPQEDELNARAMLVEHYERAHYPIAPPDPLDANLFRLDQQGITR